MSKGKRTPIGPFRMSGLNPRPQAAVRRVGAAAPLPRGAAPTAAERVARERLSGELVDPTVGRSRPWKGCQRVYVGGDPWHLPSSVQIKQGQGDAVYVLGVARRVHILVPSDLGPMELAPSVELAALVRAVHFPR